MLIESILDEDELTFYNYMQNRKVGWKTVQRKVRYILTGLAFLEILAYDGDLSCVGRTGNQMRE